MNSLIDDRDDDPRLPTRNTERRTPPREEAPAEAEQDREFTLSTGTVLGVFFALALLCAVFFGFGYTMGRKSGQASAESSLSSPAAGSDVAVSKPSAGAPAIQTIPAYQTQGEVDTANRNASMQAYRAPAVSSNATTVIVPTAPPVAVSPRVSSSAVVQPTVTVPAAPIERAPAERKPVEPRPAAPVPVAIPVVAPSATSSYVQIAAVSHQEDAEVLLSALKRRGYAVFTRPGDADKLIHVQVGPFATKKDADAMRQRLLGDGYNAIVK